MFKRGILSEIKYLRNNLIKTTYVKSDKASEDKGYDPSHKQTNGGYLAYESGESPKTYLTKEIMLEKIKISMENLKKSWENGGGSLQNLTPKPYLSLNFLFSKSINQTISILKEKYNKEELFKIFFRPSGHHYTGSYYRRTQFYKCIEGGELLLALINTTYEPPVCEQLKLGI